MVVRGNLGEPQIEFRADGSRRKAVRRSHPRTTSASGWPSFWTASFIPRRSSKARLRPAAARSPAISRSKQAQKLANVLQNPLRAPLKIDSSYDVDPTLGKDSIRSGINASICGVILVSAFMLVYYLVAGLVANVALITNIIILLGRHVLHRHDASPCRASRAWCSPSAWRWTPTC